MCLHANSVGRHRGRQGIGELFLEAEGRDALTVPRFATPCESFQVAFKKEVQKLVAQACDPGKQGEFVLLALNRSGNSPLYGRDALAVVPSQHGSLSARSANSL